MGKRKLKLGRCHKNYERRSQAAEKFKAGRPRKEKRKKGCYDEQVVSVLCEVFSLQ